MTKLNSGFEASAVCTALACSRRSDSGARAKTKASERAGKNEGRLGLPSLFSRSFAGSPLVFFPLFRSLYFSLALHYLNAWNRLVPLQTLLK